MIISKLIEVIFMFMLGMKEAFLSNNVELIGIIEHELRKKNIPYKVKTVNSGVLNRTTGTFVGRAGQSYNDLDIMYYIYSKPKYVSEIKFIANDKYPYGKPQTDEVARGSGNREYGCRRLREKLPNFSGVSFLEPGIPVIE